MQQRKQLREVYVIKKVVHGIDDWFDEINRRIWDFIYMWVRDEDDVVGASHVAIVLSNFYGVKVHINTVLKLWLYRKRLGRAPTVSPLKFILTQHFLPEQSATNQ